MLPLNNDEMNRIHNMVPVRPCHRGTDEPPNGLVAHGCGLSDVRQDEAERVSPCLIHGLHVQPHTIRPGS